MAHRYACEVEVTVPSDGFTFDVLVEGSIEQVWKGYDDDGDPMYLEVVCIERLYHVDELMSSPTFGEYCMEPTNYIQIAWKDALVEAILDKAQSDREARDEWC